MPPRRRTIVETVVPDAEILHTDDGIAGLEIPDEEEGSRVQEIAPKIPTPTISEQIKDTADRVRSLPDSIRKRAGITGTSKAKTTKVKGPRVAVDKFIGTVWSIAARMMVPIAWPVANVLKAQAPVAGMILEDVVKNTVVDTVLQPLAKIGKGGEVAMALIGPPLLVGIIAAKPESAPVAVPLLRESLRAWLDIAGPKMLERMEEERKFQEEYGTSIDELMAMFFTPPEGMAVPSDTPAE